MLIIFLVAIVHDTLSALLSLGLLFSPFGAPFGAEILLRITSRVLGKSPDSYRGSSYRLFFWFGFILVVWALMSIATPVLQMREHFFPPPAASVESPSPAGSS